ncbi:hypothetical protein AWH56_005210 [Anaerobacillus isosaccharinicus]|uniref:DUF3168 domain-containing protein n=1 Tax=Anaerobacillus isosaccharinicus TaxID=1532552 RepID=A0A1S2LBA4_9BACI|nr:hypothetical protein [Anaerobacillus isosaccharinicus]MBA5584575.1 hypothetical protein [Anaerobacillus isosaccharinicus]QOY37044.1 hypothetical protein AWH56_005210 [Anaerobacillus isosaccharinicus]
MRDMVEFVTSSLSNTGVIVSFQSLPTGMIPPNQYITFLEYFSDADLEAADEEITTERLIQANVWSKGNYSTLVNAVRKTLEQAGFERISEYDAPYTDGDSHFNKVLRFRFIDEY